MRTSAEFQHPSPGQRAASEVLWRRGRRLGAGRRPAWEPTAGGTSEPTRGFQRYSFGLDSQLEVVNLKKGPFLWSPKFALSEVAEHPFKHTQPRICFCQENLSQIPHCGGVMGTAGPSSSSTTAFWTFGFGELSPGHGSQAGTSVAPTWHIRSCRVSVC